MLLNFAGLAAPKLRDTPKMACEIAQKCENSGLDWEKIAAIVGLILAYIVARIAWNWWFGDPPGVGLDPDDPEALAAKAEARRTLPQFWAAFNHPAEDEGWFALKFNLCPEGPAELIWAGDISVREGVVYGHLLNEPVDEEFELGQRVIIDERHIVDWTYTKGDVSQGHFLSRVMLNHMPKRYVARIKKEYGWLDQPDRTPAT